MESIPTPVPPIPYAGPALLGTLLSYFLMGVLLTQLVHYIQTTGAKDKWPLQTLVTLVIVTQLIQLIFFSHIAWSMLVLGFIHPEHLIHHPKHISGVPILNGLAALYVQAFFAWRIHILGGGKVLMKLAPVVVLALGLLQFAIAIVIGVTFLRHGASTVDLSMLKEFVPVHLGTNLLCDAVITLCMILILCRLKEKTALNRTKNLLNALILNTMENGLITTAFAAGNLLAYLLRSKDIAGVAFQYVLGFIYAIVLLATLNKRESYRSDFQEVGELTVSIGQRVRDLNFSTQKGPSSDPRLTTIHFPPSVAATADRSMDEEDPMSLPKV